MVKGFYSPPPVGQPSTGTVQGSDSSGDTGLTVADGQAGLRTDGVSQLLATGDGVTMRVPIRAVAASDSPYTVSLTDHVILVDSALGAVDISLPSAVTAANRRYIIKDKGAAGSNAVSIAATSGNVDGFASVSIVNSFAHLAVVSDGSNYWVIE
tara:strand:+ start:3802 stop:4263 length:462 start_codon:yes stop_codon:yes gene_type:complete